MSWSSVSVGFWPSDLITSPSSTVVMTPVVQMRKLVSHVYTKPGDFAGLGHPIYGVILPSPSLSYIILHQHLSKSGSRTTTYKCLKDRSELGLFTLAEVVGLAYDIVLLARLKFSPKKQDRQMLHTMVMRLLMCCRAIFYLVLSRSVISPSYSYSTHLVRSKRWVVA